MGVGNWNRRHSDCRNYRDTWVKDVVIILYQFYNLSAMYICYRSNSLSEYLYVYVFIFSSANQAWLSGDNYIIANALLLSFSKTFPLFENENLKYGNARARKGVRPEDELKNKRDLLLRSLWSAFLSFPEIWPIVKKLANKSLRGWMWQKTGKAGIRCPWSKLCLNSINLPSVQVNQNCPEDFWSTDW